MIKKILLAILLLSSNAIIILAQTKPEQSILNAQDQFFDIKKRSVEMERMKREADKKPLEAGSTKNLADIKEDFEQIQKLNDSIYQFTKIPDQINANLVL